MSSTNQSQKNMDDSTIRVLVFGGTGVGKTSLCNTLTGRSRPTGNGASGVTAKSHLYNAFEHQGRKIRLFDTVGLHESSFGTVPAEEALSHVVELIKKAKDGFSLLIHVARASRITKDQEDDYKFFVEKLTEEKIPVLLVLTGCENEEPMTAWVGRNRKSFERFKYAEIISTCFMTGGKFESDYALLRTESKKLLLDAVLTHALASPRLLYGKGTGNTFSKILMRVWNSFVDIGGLPKKLRLQVNESALDLMNRLGVSQKLQKLATDHLPDLVEEMANKLPIPGSGKLAKAVVRYFLRK